MTIEFESTINIDEEEDVEVFVSACLTPGGGDGWNEPYCDAQAEVYEVTRADTGQDVTAAVGRYALERLECEAMAESPC